MAARNQQPSSTPEPEQTSPAPQAASTTSTSVLERLRHNRMGAVLGSVVVALALALLLSILVPDSQRLLALVVLGAAEAAAVGFTVRVLTYERGLATQVTAFVAAAIGTHVLASTGMVNQAIGDLGALGGLLGGGNVNSGLGWDDALLTALATPTLSTGAVLAGLAAAMIAGWGPRPVVDADAQWRP